MSFYGDNNWIWILVYFQACGGNCEKCNLEVACIELQTTN